MGMDPMPREVYEALRDLDLDGQEAEIAPNMIEILQEQGYAEILDGIPSVTEAGHVALRDREQEFSGPIGKAD